MLSASNRNFYDYFKQRFAQVTNPPIDHLRERMVMSLDTYLGRRGSLLDHTPAPAPGDSPLKPDIESDRASDLVRIGGDSKLLFCKHC